MAKKKKSKKGKNGSAQQKKENNKVLEFMKAAWCIVCNKNDTENRITSAALSVMLSSFLNLIAFLLALVALYGAGNGIYGAACAITTSVSEVLSKLVQILFAIMIAMFALILRGMANEIERETDINHLLALFSGITGFITLILSLRGVG